VIWVVVPAYNEAENIPVLFERLRPVLAELGARLVMVDDGSTDETAAQIRRHAGDVDCTIVRNPANGGVGIALNSGIRHVLEVAADDDALVTLESDNTSDLADLPKMLALFDEGYDVVLASVYAPGGRLLGVSRLRILMSRVVSDTFRWLGGLRRIHTLSSLYRVYRVGVVRRAAETYGWLLVREPGFAASVELLLKLYHGGATIAEIPTTNDWRERRGQSKMRLMPTVIAYFRVAVAHLAGRIQPVRNSPLAGEDPVVERVSAAASELGSHRRAG
jgi:dolichol-phosphate mannosyltransferase